MIDPSKIWIQFVAARLVRSLVVVGIQLSWMLPASAQVADHRPLIILAAASLTVALDEVTTAFAKREGVEVKTEYGGSSTLARQLEAGAPADIFISADIEWMDYASKKGLIRPESRVDLLGNNLVLIEPVGSTLTLELKPGVDLAIALGGGRLAIADPESVPAGRYGKAALTALGSWDAIANHLVRAENVRVALSYVALGEAPLGIVYGTDAKSEPKVKIVAIFPPGSHMPIIYPAALTTKSQAAAGKLLEFLKAPQAWEVFSKAGFTKPN